MGAGAWHRVADAGAGDKRPEADEQNPRGERPEPEHTVVGPGETRTDPAQPGHVKVAVVQPGHRLGHGDLAEPVDLRVGDAGNGIPTPSRTRLCAPSQPTRYRAVSW
jgi:hypothetical protein